MADNIAVTAGSGTTIGADEVVDGTLGTVKVGFGKIMDGTLDSTNKLIVTAAGAAKVDGSGVTQPVSGTVTATVASTSSVAAAVPANSAYQGLQAQTANPSAATAGNLVGALGDKIGRQVTTQSIRDLKADATLTLTASTAETTLIAAIASTFNDLYGLIIENTSTVGTEISFRDVAAGTVRFTMYCPPLDTRGFMLPESGAWKQATVNTAWTAQCTTSVSSIKISALYVKNI